MASFLTTNGVSNAIEQIIINAHQKLELVSPYLKISSILLVRLQDADRRGVPITIVYGKEDLTPEQRSQLNQLKNLKLLFCGNLHAKCYANESSCVLSSMNMYEFSEKNNREMGVLISAAEDAVLYRDTMAEVELIIRSSVTKNEKDKPVQKTPAPASTVNDRYSSRQATPQGREVSPVASTAGAIGSFLGGIAKAAFTSQKRDGFCVRCGTGLPHDPGKPFCASCYQSWSQFANKDYQEKYCHSCGKAYKTSFARPECNRCYGK
jgi:hypothetical protein